jgi:hypothetical protein
MKTQGGMLAQRWDDPLGQAPLLRTTLDVPAKADFVEVWPGVVSGPLS